MRVASASFVTAKKNCSVQYGALPYRVVDGRLEILLITTLRSRRWIIPKGWPITGQTPQASAAREALEEAGVCGEIEPKAIGSFRYFKQLKNGDMTLCSVEVFALKVTQQRKTWAEKASRELRWCSVDQALAAISEAPLRQLITKFATALAAAS
ncbi:MAG TPA: NUDIX hydrolase [Rhizomicrobium sp.]|nr:NUDIX hydrolase [Rhizomicrobium sp.]